MNLLKTFLLAVLTAPAALVGMEEGLLETWKQPRYHRVLDRYHRASDPAPRIFQVLMRAAAKELKVPDNSYVHTAFALPPPKHYYESRLLGLTLPTKPAKILLNPLELSVFGIQIGLKKSVMLHEMAHVLHMENAAARIKSAEARRAEEHFADTQAVTHLACFYCAQELSVSRLLEQDDFFKQGYLRGKEISDLANKTYGVNARCPFHRKMELVATSFTKFIYWGWDNEKQLFEKFAELFEHEMVNGSMQIFEECCDCT